MTHILKIGLAAATIVFATHSGALASEWGIQLAQSACQSIGQRTAADAGATLLAVSDVTVNGSPACEVVMLVPAGDGERPRREVVVVQR